MITDGSSGKTNKYNLHINLNDNVVGIYPRDAHGDAYGRLIFPISDLSEVIEVLDRVRTAVKHDEQRV